MPRLVNDPSSVTSSDLSAKTLPASRPLRASAAITAKRVVSYTTEANVATTATDGTPSLVAGIAVTAAAATGDIVEVVWNGVVDNVPCEGTVSAGMLLTRSANTAGWVAATATPAEGEVVGVAINASASNVVDVLVGHGGGPGTA
jgi:hypothetical protein